MPTITKAKTKKQAPETLAKKHPLPLIPPTAGVTKVDGREFVIMPLEDFAEWQDERMFATLVRERLENDEPFVPFEQIVASVNKSGKAR